MPWASRLSRRTCGPPPLVWALMLACCHGLWITGTRPGRGLFPQKVTATPPCLKLVFRFRRASQAVVGFFWLHFHPVKMHLLHYRTAKRSLFLKADFERRRRGVLGV